MKPGPSLGQGLCWGDANRLVAVIGHFDPPGGACAQVFFVLNRVGLRATKLRGCFLQGNAFQVQALWRNIHFIIPDDRMVCHASLHEQLALFQHLKRGIGQVGRHIKLPMAYLKGSIL